MLKTENHESSVLEHTFGLPLPPEEERVMPERANVREETDAARRQRRLQDPEVQKRIREIQDEVKGGKNPGPGITAEELPDFLREQKD